MMTHLKIKQTHEFYASHRTGTLTDVTIDEVSALLGFTPERFSEDDGDGKVTCQWQFEVNGTPCSIWDYKGSLTFKQLSVWMPSDIATRLFGNYIDAICYVGEGQY